MDEQATGERLPSSRHEVQSASHSAAQIALLQQLSSAADPPTVTESVRTSSTRTSRNNSLNQSPITASIPAGALDFASPSTYLRPRSSTLGSITGSLSGSVVLTGDTMPAQAAADHPPAPPHQLPYHTQHQQRISQTSIIDQEQKIGLKRVRQLLRKRTGYDVLPISYRLIILDTSLLVQASLNVLTQNSIVSAPLWNSKNSTFAGLITAQDYINVVQYYWQNPNALGQIGQFRLDSLPEIEKAIGVTPVETISIHPERPLYEACKLMLESRARRIPLVDIDDETQRAMVVSVITQYRILKFITVNTQEILMLGKPLKDINIGTFEGLVTASMDMPVIDAIHLLVKKSISSIPIVDSDGVLLNVFEAVDVITLIKGGHYEDLTLPLGEAILKRSDDFEGIHTCSVHDCLATILDTVRKSRVHRFVVIDAQAKFVGMLTLSDILAYLLHGEASDEEALQL